MDSYVLKEKFRNMKFIHLSPTTDFSSELQSQLRILNGNILYITREVDKILKFIEHLKIEENLQKQVDEYYGHDDDHFPEDSKQEDSSKLEQNGD